MKNAPSVCFYFMTLMQLEEEEPARVVISIDSLLGLFKQPATILQLQLCSFSNLLTDRSDYWINLVVFTPPADFCKKTQKNKELAVLVLKRQLKPQNNGDHPTVGSSAMNDR